MAQAGLDWLGWMWCQGRCQVCSLSSWQLWWRGHWLALGCKRRNNLTGEVSLGHIESRGPAGQCRERSSQRQGMRLQLKRGSGLDSEWKPLRSSPAPAFD